jgi:hypothetical protein
MTRNLSSLLFPAIAAAILLAASIGVLTAISPAPLGNRIAVTDLPVIDANAPFLAGIAGA